MMRTGKLDGKTYGVRVTKKMEEEIELYKTKYPLSFDPLDICREALLVKLNDFKGEKGQLRDKITKIKSKINKLEESIDNNNNILLDLTTSKEDLESILLDLEEKLEKTEEKIEEGDVVMNLINAVERVKNQYSLGKPPSTEVLTKLSIETRIRPDIIKMLGYQYEKGKITREELEEMEEERVRYLIEHSPQHAPTFDFKLTGDNIINYLTGRLSPSK